MLTYGRTQMPSPDAELRRLATLAGAGISIAGVLLLVIIGYAGWSSNQNSTDRERTLLDNALNRSIARALNEQKSVAWWDEAITKVASASAGSSEDMDWVQSNFGVYLTETYGHDEVYIVDSADKPIYVYSQGERRDVQTFDLQKNILAPVIAEVRGAAEASAFPKLKVRPDAFGADQGNYRTIGSPLETARWAGHILPLDGKLVIVAAMTIVPNVDMSLLKNKPDLLVSVTNIDDPLVTVIGRSLMLDDLKMMPSFSKRDSMVSQAFIADDGTQSGFLTWTTQKPGQVLLHMILPLVALGVVSVATLANGMFRRLKASTSELAVQELQSRHDARHDALSSLPNRAHFAERLADALHEVANSQTGRHVVVAYVDIDNFKDVNDTLGHPAGDELIKIVAARLDSHMRGDTVLSRYGGDEFAIFWLANSPGAGKALAKRIKQIFDQEFDVHGQTLRVTASAGIVVQSSAGGTGDELMRQADIALYEAKTQGRNRAVFFSEDMAVRVAERRAIELDLKSALENNVLRLNYQPIICCSTGAIVGLEALLRWRHPERGEIPPASFIPIAEQSGLMPALGEWVLARAMTDQHLWRHLQVSVNLSPVQFRQIELEAVLQRLVNEHGINPRQFVLEITEGVLMESCERTSRTLDAIHDMGFLTALDDFGTGYSSLAYLCNFRFDKIKIDRSFVAGMSKSASYEKIVHAIIALGGGLGMEIVAEGVETEAEVRVMTALGCSQLQGYYFSRPIECNDMVKLIATYVPQPLLNNVLDIHSATKAIVAS